MTATLVEMLDDPVVQAVYEATTAWMMAAHRHPATVRLAARAWRARERAATLAPLSDKVVYPRRLVDAPPPPPKRRQGK